MKSDVLSSIFSEQKGVRRDGSAFVLEETLHATVFVTSASDIISMARVVRVEVGKEICTFTTIKSERYFFPYEVIIGVKLETAEEGKKSPGTAGFR